MNELLYEELYNRPVLVKWTDSMTAHGWVTLTEDSLDDLPIIDSVGFLIKENTKGILIVGDLFIQDEHRDANRPIKIPKGCIVSIQPID